MNNTDKKLNEIHSELQQIKKDIRIIHTHNSFVTKIYFLIKDTIVNLFTGPKPIIYNTIEKDDEYYFQEIL